MKKIGKLNPNIQTLEEKTLYIFNTNQINQQILPSN